MELRVGNRYRLGRKIGSGSFGDIYLGTNISTGEEVAIKLECIKTKHPQLHIESKFYKMMQGGVGIPVIKWCGSEGDYNVMVMELLGPSLEDLFNFCSRKFSLKTVLLLADQLISRIEYIHMKNFIHRDIKPDNFLMGLGKKGNLVYIIDFGLAKKYRDTRTHQHIGYRENKNLTGTARYASINTHLGIEQSRRDDMESLGYVLMYFTQGSLPWQGLRAATKQQKYERISEKKMSTPIEVLCNGAPSEFATYLNYCRSLRFDEKPDYSYLRQLFRNLFHRQGFTYDYIFDWNMLKFGGSRSQEQEDRRGSHHQHSSTTRAVQGPTTTTSSRVRSGQEATVGATASPTTALSPCPASRTTAEHDRRVSMRLHRGGPNPISSASGPSSSVAAPPLPSVGDFMNNVMDTSRRIPTPVVVPGSIPNASTGANTTSRRGSNAKETVPLKFLMSQSAEKIGGLRTKDALSRLREEISHELDSFKSKLDNNGDSTRFKAAPVFHMFSHRNPHSTFPWPSVLFSCLTFSLLFVCYWQEEDRRYDYLLFESSVLLLFTVVNIYFLVHDFDLMRYEIINKGKSMLTFLDKCIAKCEWNLHHFPQLNMPFSPCINLQPTYRDGQEVNLHWPLLVKGDVIKLRPGQVVPGLCRFHDGDCDTYINFEDVYAPPKGQSLDIFSTPQLRMPAASRLAVLQETPYIRHLRIALEKSLDRPTSYFIKERHIILIKYLQCTAIPCLLFVMLIINTLRYLYLWNYVGHWTEMFILLQVEAIVPLLPLAFPTCWFLLNTYGLARLAGMFSHSKQSKLPCDVNADDWGETAPSLQLIIDFNWRQLKHHMCDIIRGKNETLCRSANILHALGSVTTLCCVDKKGILSGPNPTPEKVFFLKRKSGSSSADMTINNSNSSKESVFRGAPELNTRASEPDVCLADNESCLRESHVEVLDLTYNNQAPLSIQFDDPKWKKHINNLKPLGLAILLNTCNPKTQNYYTEFYSHITCETLHNDVVVPVVSRRCLCELARHIGFIDTALDIFQLQHHLSTFRHLPSEQARRDRLARSMPCSKVRFPFPHMASVVVQDLNTGMSQLMSQGTGDLILDSCSDFWDGHDLQPLSESDRKKILDFYHRTSLTSYCSAFSYRPINAQISDYLSKVYLEMPAKSERLYTSLFSPSPHRNKWIMNRCLSSDSLLGQNAQDVELINDAESCFETQSNQVFIGMVAMQYQARTEMVRLIEQLDKACIRFVHFSKENELRSRVFSEKMGLESGWNCHISLLSEKPNKSESQTLIKDSQLNLSQKQQLSTDEFINNIDGLSSPKLKSNLESLKTLSYSAPSAINLEMNTVKFDDDMSLGSAALDHPLRCTTGEMRSTTPLSHDDCDITDALIGNRRPSVGISRSPSHITESTEQSAPVAFDMSNRAKLPKGIENIRPHLQNIDNVPLLVSLFTDCTPDVTKEMIKIMQEYGEVVCCMGSSACLYNIDLFIQANTSIAIEPQYPQLCLRNPVHESSYSGFPLPFEVSHRLISLPCSLDYYQNDPVNIYHLVIEARHFTMSMRNCFYFYLSCSLSLSVMILLSSAFLLPPPLTLSQILFFVLFTIPILSLSLIGCPLDDNISNVATAKNIDIITKKMVLGFLGYLGIRFLPSIGICLLCFALTLNSMCSKITHASQHTCSILFGDINFGQPNEWNGWGNIHNYSLSVSHNITAFFLSVYFVCISINFIHRSHQLWNRSPLSNRLWVICSVTVIMLHLTYLAVDLHIKAAQVAVLQAGLEDVAIEVWIIACLWPLCLIMINELVKRHQLKVDVRNLKRARLEFGTKLGMNSPF
ncbi:hypothetical protein CHUAL_003446 [Chamberlinius hualienensis]